MGVNFTKNRAWWHTAIWDEYGQRHQYLALIPTLLIMIPYYYHGAAINRDLEQNFAAKMYQLDYEQKRNRLTHNLIMEHFETHVEKTQDLLEEIQQNGFEETFKDQIEEGIFTEVPKEKTGYLNTEDWSDEKRAEFGEFTKLSYYIDYLVKTKPLFFNYKENLLNKAPRRKYTSKPWTNLEDIPLSTSREEVEHEIFVPSLKLSEEQMKSIRIKGQGEEEEEE